MKKDPQDTSACVLCGLQSLPTETRCGGAEVVWSVRTKIPDVKSMCALRCSKSQTSVAMEKSGGGCWRTKICKDNEPCVLWDLQIWNIVTPCGGGEVVGGGRKMQKPRDGCVLYVFQISPTRIRCGEAEVGVLVSQE